MPVVAFKVLCKHFYSLEIYGFEREVFAGVVVVVVVIFVISKDLGSMA